MHACVQRPIQLITMAQSAPCADRRRAARVRARLCDAIERDAGRACVLVVSSNGNAHKHNTSCVPRPEGSLARAGETMPRHALAARPGGPARRECDLALMRPTECATMRSANGRGAFLHPLGGNERPARLHYTRWRVRLSASARVCACTGDSMVGRRCALGHSAPRLVANFAARRTRAPRQNGLLERSSGAGGDRVARVHWT